MKRKLLKQLVCVLGIVFMTFPAWSAVPSNLLPEDGSLQQTRVTNDFDSGMILAKGGKSDSGGGSRGGNSDSGGQGGDSNSGGQGGSEDKGQGGNEDSGGPNGPGDGTCDNCDGEPDQLREQKQLQEQELLQKHLQVQEQSQLQIQQQLWLQTQLQEHTSAGNGGPAQ